MRYLLSLMSCLTMTMVSFGQQTTVFSEAFNTNGALLGTTPQTGGVWTITGTNVTNPFTVTSNALPIANNGQDAFASFSSQVATTAGNSIRSNFTINVSAANAAGDYFFHLSDPAGTTNNFYSRVFVQSSGAGYVMGVQANSGGGSVPTYGTTVLNLNQPVTVQLDWTFVAGTLNDTFSLTVNGSSYVNAAWSGVMGAEPAATVSAVNIRQGTTANAPTLTMDNLTVISFTPVPEPASMCGLAGLAMAGVAGVRRYWKK